MPLQQLTLDALEIDDEASFGHVALYAQLKRAVRESGHRFFVPAPGTEISWDRAVFLNLTYWSGDESSDVLCEPRISADVVAHIAFHHLAGRAIKAQGEAAPPCADALFFAESIASAFDLYLVGRLLPNVPDSDFITTQVPIMREAAEEAGLDDAGFEALLHAVIEDPERAFEALRSLLFDVARGLLTCRDPGAAQQLLEGFTGHRFAPLLHHYQLSNWVLYARAYARPDAAQRARTLEFDRALRQSENAVEWLSAHFL